MFDLNIRLGVLAVCAASALAGCKDGSPPVLQDPGDQVAVVGQPLTVNLIASDPDGGRLTYSFKSPIEGISSHAAIRQTPDGQGVFEYTPVAGHEGMHIFDFIASDGEFNTQLPISIEVRGASGSDSAPIFREPLAGLVIEGDDECTAIDILIEDIDSTEISLTDLPPKITGAQLSASADGKMGTWEWCPSREQREVTEHQLTLSADDGDNPATIKAVPIYVRPGTGEGCPGDPPTIEHEPEDFSTLQDLSIEIVVSDDMGIRSAPKVLYAFENPVVDGNVDFSKFQVGAMTLTDGDMLSGTWVASIPNPTAKTGEGTTADLYYVVEVVDDDDAEGDCDHRTDSPRSGVHEVTVTNNGDTGRGGGLCEPCSFDAQCGDEGDLCIQLEASICASACGADGCPSGYECSEDPVTSLGGAAARQCIPVSGTCNGGGSCEGDSYDPEDDTPAGADESSIDFDYTGTQTVCPDNEDWFAIIISEPTTLTVSVDGDFPPDIDLYLLNEAQEGIADSDDFNSSFETVTATCIGAGKYYALVDSYQAEEGGEYDIEITLDTDACNTVSPCCTPTMDSTPGCASDSALEDCVCEEDTLCCQSPPGWDSTCVDVATTMCGLTCPA